MPSKFTELDNQHFGRFHLKAIILSGIGFFTDAYDIFIINIAIPMIAFSWYFKESPQLSHTDNMPSATKSLLKASTQIGTLVGQLLFGYLSDRLGRKSMFGVVLAIMIVAAINSSLAADTHGGIKIGFMLILWRLILGVGIGGDYPISAVITSEFALVNRRGMMIAAVFAMQGFGALLGSVLGIIVLVAMKSHLQPPDPKSVYVPNIDNVWRLLFFLGIVPATIAMYWRLGMPETPRFSSERGDEEMAMRDMAKVTHGKQPQSQRHQTVDSAAQLTEDGHGDAVTTRQDDTPPPPPADGQQVDKATFWRVFRQWRNAKVLIGTSVSWFLLDVGFYGVQLNQSDIIKFMGYGEGSTAYEYFYNLAIGNLFLSVCGSFPGYWASVFTIERFGRTKLQLMGFIVLSIIFIILTATFRSLQGHAGLVVLFAFANFFFNFGPNVTTFVIPAEIFPTRFRSTCHGISAAAGKLGAILASVSFDQIPGDKNRHMTVVLAIFSVCMILGIFSTLLIPETKGKTLEELEEVFDLPPEDRHAVSEFWKSNAKFWCKYCKIFVTDNKPSRTNHDQGNRHKYNVQQFMRDLRKRDAEAAAEQREAQRVMRGIERDAMKAYANDMRAAAAEEEKSTSSASASTGLPQRPQAPRRAVIINGVDYSGYGLGRDPNQPADNASAAWTHPDQVQEEEEEEEADSGEREQPAQDDGAAPRWQTVNEIIIKSPVEDDKNAKRAHVEREDEDEDEIFGANDAENLHEFKITTKEVPPGADALDDSAAPATAVFKKRKVATGKGKSLRKK
ncbi:hypothetical protein RI367_007347 [Sorochytrium milnesiophthora]